MAYNTSNVNKNLIHERLRLMREAIQHNDPVCATLCNVGLLVQLLVDELIAIHAHIESQADTAIDIRSVLDQLNATTAGLATTAVDIRQKLDKVKDALQSLASCVKDNGEGDQNQFVILRQTQ